VEVLLRGVGGNQREAERNEINAAMVLDWLCLGIFDRLKSVAMI